VFDSSTPCYSELTDASNTLYYTQDNTPTSAKPSTGYGVEWILGGKTWFDVHTVHLELFTRLGGVSSEGAQEISIREIPPACGGSVLVPCGATGWNVSTPGAIQIFQVDQNNHVPAVFIHGGIYTPHNNIELYTNSAGGASLAYTGPIDANSIELASQTAGGNVIIGAGGSADTTFQLTVVSNGNGGGPAEQPFTEQAVIKQTSGVWKVLSWRVCSGSNNQTPGTAAFCDGKQG